MSVVDSTDSQINPAANSSVTVVPVEMVANNDPITGAQVQPRVLARQIPSSTARGQMQLGAPNIFTDSANQRIMVQDDSSVPVVSIGNIGTDTNGLKEWGMKVAKPGIDVTQATDDQLFFNSQQDVFKIIYTNTQTLAGAGAGSSNGVTVTIPGTFAALPAVLAFLTNNGNAGSVNLNINWVNTGSGYAGLTQIQTVSASLSGSNVVIDFVTFNYAAVPDPNVYIWKYYVLQQTAA